MGTHLVVIDPPRLDPRARIVEVEKPVLVEALVTELAVERFDEGIVDRFTGSDEMQLNAILGRPRVERAAGKFGSVVDDDLLREWSHGSDPIEDPGNTLTREPVIDFDRQTLPAAIVDEIECAKRTSVGERVAHEVHG